MTAYALPAPDPTNVVGRRIVAYLIDLLIAFVIVLAFSVPAFTSSADQVDTGGRTDFCDDFDNRNTFCLPLGDTAYLLRDDNLGGVAAAFYGSGFVWLLINSVLLQGLTGGTLGKLLLGLRVVRYDGRRAGIGRSALRTLLLPVDAFFCGVIGLTTSLTTKGHRRVGDMAASTLVVRKEYEDHPIDVPGLTTVDVGAGGMPAPWGAVPQPAPPVAAAPAGVNGPAWDPARNAYIQYDPGRSSWVQWNDTSKEWRPIDQ